MEKLNTNNLKDLAVLLTAGYEKIDNYSYAIAQFDPDDAWIRQGSDFINLNYEQVMEIAKRLRRERASTRRLKKAKEFAAKCGCTITRKNGEFRVNFKGGEEATAYYTDDLQDAMYTATAMEKQSCQRWQIMADIYWISLPPTKCDICGAPIKGYFYDAASRLGWACMCMECFTIGPGFGRLGTGLGQRYKKQADGRWLKVGG